MDEKLFTKADEVLDSSLSFILVNCINLSHELMKKMEEESIAADVDFGEGWDAQEKNMIIDTFLSRLKEELKG